MDPVATRPDNSFKPLQVAAVIRATSVAAVEPVPNLASQVVKSGSPKPHATVSNGMVAQVDSYTPPPGRNMAHYVALDVDKAGGWDAPVAHAIQRHLGVSPIREPGGDPLDVDSLDSYPSLVLDEDAAWRDAWPYRFSVNGVVQGQVQPTFHLLGGSLRARVVGTGVATIQTPASEGPPPLQAGPIPAGAYYPPALAAQLAMRRLTDLYDQSGGAEPLEAAPDPGRGLNDTLASVAATLAPMRGGGAGQRISESVQAGMARFANLGLYGQSPRLYLTAVAATT
jgi:hypothetical protein